MSYQCPQCGRAIRFEGLCLVCEIENKKREILELNDEELAAKTAEVTVYGSFDEDLCLRLITLRGINTEKIAEYAWKEREFGVPEVFMFGRITPRTSRTKSISILMFFFR